MAALFITLFLPLLGSIILLFYNRENHQAIKYSALGFSVASFVVSLFLFFGFNTGVAGFQFVFSTIWVESLDAGFRIGIDGMSLLLVMLTTFISPIAILASFNYIQKHQKEYYFMMLLLQFGMTGVFVSLDLFLFYIFWELILIPMYFIIGVWGGKDRIYAAIKFFIFTMVGSLLMLLAIIWLGYYCGSELIGNAQGFTTDFIAIREVAPMIPFEIQKWMFLAFALSFCIKVPLFPLHTWLPDAHTEAPTAGSVILAGVLLKMGTYGLIRFNLELFPQSSFEYASPIAWLAVVGIIYGALVAMVQTDVKRLVAYSSVSHLGFVVLGIFSMTAEGVQGAIIQMVNHGLSTGMLFLCVGILYERRHTRDIEEFGGIARVMPAFTVFFALAMLASVGLPGLNGFVGEYLTLLGAFRSPFLNSWAYTIIGATGVIFAAVYLLWMFQRVMYKKIDNPANRSLSDVSKREVWTLVPIVIFIVWIGVYPNTFLKYSEFSTRALVNKLEKIKFGKGSYWVPEKVTEKETEESKTKSIEN
jgi:NADH-quinone oxidoreductase subunit M